MKRLSNIFVAVAVCLLLTGCGIYKKYEQNTPTPSDVFGNDKSIQEATGETTIAKMISIPHALQSKRARRH